jgi:hypothetical protein
MRRRDARKDVFQILQKFGRTDVRYVIKERTRVADVIRERDVRHEFARQLSRKAGLRIHIQPSFLDYATVKNVITILDHSPLPGGDKTKGRPILDYNPPLGGDKTKGRGEED